MALPADERGKQALFGARESRHVGVFRDVGTVPLVAVMRNIEADLVQASRPDQPLFGEFRRERRARESFGDFLVRSGVLAALANEEAA